MTLDGNGFLKNNRTVIEFFIYNMNGRARTCSSLSNDGFMDEMPEHPLSPECGKQRRVDVEDSVPITPDDHRIDLLHVTGENNQIDPVRFQRGKNRCGKNILRRKLLLADMKSRDEQRPGKR